VTPPDVFAFAHGIGPSGRKPGTATIGARLAGISSFYRFLIRMGLVTSNPCDQLERPRATPSTPRGLSTDEIVRLLAVIPDKPAGLRDRAIILTLVLPGRRKTEVMNLKATDIMQFGGLVQGLTRLVIPPCLPWASIRAIWGGTSSARRATSYWPGAVSSG
jgi:site-specific recombinase XerC